MRRDTGFRNDEEVAAALGVPVLAVVPAMLSAYERRQYRRRRLGLTIAVLVAVTLCSAAVAWAIFFR